MYQNMFSAIAYCPDDFLNTFCHLQKFLSYNLHISYLFIIFWIKKGHG